MLSIGLVRTASNAAKYYEKDDYYAPDPAEEGSAAREGGDVQGRWGGRGAAALELMGAVEKAQFQKVLEGQLPNGIVLGRRKDGEVQHTPGWDLTFSAPKSVSMLVEIGGDERLREAHDHAVDSALQWVEEHALGTRQRTVAGQLFEATGSMVVAKFTHHTSRNQDPSLHTHAVVINATETASGEWKSVHSMELFRNKMVAGQIYRSALARAALALGYSLDVNAKDGTFELREVPETFRRALSTRRAQVAAKLAQWGANGPEHAARAAILTRQSKQDTPHRELQERWREAAALRGIDVGEWRRQAEARGPSVEPAGLDREQALREAIARNAEPEAAFSHGALLRHALRMTLGRSTMESMEDAVREAADDGRLIRTDDGDIRRWTTPQARTQEQRALQLVLESRSKPFAAERGTQPAEERPGSLTDGQRAAVELVLGTDASHMAVLGRPGTGKTTMLATLREQLEGRGVSVTGMAQNAAAAANLQEEAGMRSLTIHRHLRQIGPQLLRARRGLVPWWSQLLSPRQLWVVDEASQLSNALTSRLLWAADTLGARVLFVGDNKQLAAIEAGRPFDLLLEKGLKHVEMDQILRQRDPQDLAAVRAAIRGDVRGALDRLESRLEVVEDREARLDAMVRRWAGHPEQRGHTLLLTARNPERAALNEGVRNVLRAEGRLSGERSRVTLEKVFGTRADTRELHHYAPGQLLLFPSGVKSRGIADGEYLRVMNIEADQGTVTIAREHSDERITWHPREDAPRKAFPVAAYEERATTLALGEKVRWLRNSQSLQLVNGEQLIVEAISGDTTTLRHEDGRTVTIDARSPEAQHWTHAYASTVYRSQGQTARRAIVNLDSVSGRLLSQKAFLVAISRHRDAVSIYTDSRKELEQRLERHTGDKTSAIAEIERHARTSTAMRLAEQSQRQQDTEVRQRDREAMRGMER